MKEVMVAMETVTNQYLDGDSSLACSAETQKEIDKKVAVLYSLWLIAYCLTEAVLLPQERDTREKICSGQHFG